MPYDGREFWARIVEKHGGEKLGRNDSPEYIRDKGNSSFRVFGRLLFVHEDGRIECFD